MFVLYKCQIYANIIEITSTSKTQIIQWNKTILIRSQI